MPAPTLERATLDDHGTEDGTTVFVMRLTDGDNRFNRRNLDAITACLDEVDGADGPKGLVAIGTGKFFSNGLDLDWLATGEEDLVPFISDVMTMWARLLAAPYPTAAAVNGHAFAGGAMFALAFDQRVMRSDRGFWCVNEVLLGMDLPDGMRAIITSHLSAHDAHRAITTAHRFDAEEALSIGLADAVAREAEVEAVAIERVAQLTHTASPNLGVLKAGLYRDTIAALRSSN